MSNELIVSKNTVLVPARERFLRQTVFVGEQGVPLD